MHAWRMIAAFCSLTVAAVTALGADQPRTYQENGVTYQEVRERVRVPVTETNYQQRQQTVYRLETSNKVHESQYATYVPVTECRWEAYRTGVLNPFVPPTTAYRLVPYTRWEPRIATVRVPMTSQQWVPETQTVQVPVRTLKFVEKEQLRRVAVMPSVVRPGSAAATTRVATNPGYGGIGQLQSDPPRFGTGPTTIRR